MRLFKTILLLMLVAAVVPILGVGALAISDTREMLKGNAQELAQERVRQLSFRSEALLADSGRAVTSLARVYKFFQLPLTEQQTLIHNLLVDRHEVSVITVFDARKQRVPMLQAFDIPAAELAEHTRQAEALLQDITGLRTSLPYPSPSRGIAVVTLVFPVGDPNKPFQGFVGAEVSLEGLHKVLDALPVGSTGFAYVVDLKGRLVAGPSVKMAGLKAGDDVSGRPAVANCLRTLEKAGRSEVRRVGNFGEGADAVVGAYQVAPDLGWAVVSEQPVRQAYAQVRKMEQKVAGGVGLAVAVAAALAWTFSRNLTRPLRSFTATALELAKGKFGVQVPVESKNEIGELAQTFNYMSSTLQASDQEKQRLYESLEKGYLETIVALANSIDSKDSYTRGHSQRVGDFAVEIGRELGLTERELKHLHYGGILHDIGKIGIVESILCKQSKLTDSEMAIMRTHPEIGALIIEPVTFLGPVRSAVRSHHENWDGTGYPDRTKGEEIPLVARIVAAADTFDACTSTRPYQKAMPLADAMAVMEKLRGARLDPAVVDALRRVVEKKGVRLEGQRIPVKLAS
ncbi:MAG TPA: HD domain-containing phosphohydrolase [Myxococcaceae bacterium]|nr:HD domain-containing phosphohydrolase [Myxococcaceae bacterium]